MGTAPPLGEPPTPPPTARVALAAAVRDATLAVPGVAGLVAAGPASGRHETVPGVTVLPQAGGSFRVSVRLVAGLVPLPALAERVRRAVRHSGHLLTDLPIGAIDVDVARVVAPGEEP